MSKTAGRILLLCAVTGLVASGAATYVHYKMLTDPAYTSFCDVNATVSCTVVYASRFGTFRGIPVAIFGGLWFAFATLLTVAGMTAGSTVRENVPGYLFAGSTLALAVVLYLGYASFFILKSLCLVCVTTYVAAIGQFLVSGAATPFSMMSLPRRAMGDLKTLVSNPLAVAVTVLFLGGAATTLAFFPRELPAAAVGDSAAAVGDSAPAVGQEQRTELERFMATAVRVPLMIPTLGAKVLIVKFNDYQCPACAQSYLAYKPVLAKYLSTRPGEVRLVMKDYPLNPECNADLSTMMHPAACDAAVAVRLARQHGRGDQMEEWLYTHQEGMTTQSVRQAARDIGLVTDFDEKYASTIESVKSDIAMGKTLKVRQTPTFFINGVEIDGAWAPRFFDQAIAYELEHAK